MKFGASGLENEPTEWVRAHGALSRLAKERAAADAEEGRWLLAALRSSAYVHLGFGSFAEYVERLFGYKPRSTQEKLRVAEALEGLPVIAEALEEGSLNWSCARELTRVAVAQTEREWLAVACGKTVHQLEALVAGKTPGDKPSSPSDSSARRHVLRFEVTPETLALFREAMNRLRRSSGSQVDDDSALMLMARHVLGGPSDEGRASYQIALSVCPECGSGGQQASGQLMPVGAEVVAMASTWVCSMRPWRTRARAPPRTRAAIEALLARPRRAVAGRAPTRALARSKPSRQRRAGRYSFATTTAVPFLVAETRCSWIFITSSSAPRAAETRSTTSSPFAARITEQLSSGVRFRHPDGSDYGQLAKPQVAETHAKTFAALRCLGFRERAVRRVLAEISQSSDGRQPDLESVLRSALSRLTTS